MQNLLARVKNPALRQGLFFGVILGIILIALSFFTSGLLIPLILCLLAAFMAGMRASQETGKLSTGALAGLWTGLFGLFIPTVISMILLFVNLDAVRKNAQTIADQQHLHITYTNSLILTNLLINFLIIIALGILFGIAGGAVGGNIGRRRAQLPPPEEYQETKVESPSPTSPPQE